MTESTAETPHATTDVPWWNIESPLRRRIKGRYVRRAILVACIANVAFVAYAPRAMAPDAAFVARAAPDLRMGLRETRSDADALALMAAAAP